MSLSTWYDIHTITLSLPTGQWNPIRKAIWTEQSPPFPHSALWKTLSWYWIKESSQNVNEQTPAPLERITSIDILTFVYTNYIHVSENWDICLAAKKRWRVLVLTDRRQVSPSDIIHWELNSMSSQNDVWKCASFTSLFVCLFVFHTMKVLYNVLWTSMFFNTHIFMFHRRTKVKKVWNEGEFSFSGDLFL